MQGPHGCLVEWLVDWLIGWLVDRTPDAGALFACKVRMVQLLVAWLGWSLGMLVCWLVD
jgi:hypothetical protein